MSNFFNMDSPFFSFMSRLADIVILNLLYIICCLPVFTVGAATSALYYQVMKMSKNEESYVFRSFFKAFRENFKKATLSWLILLVIAILLVLDLYLAPALGSDTVVNGFRVICYVACLLWLITFSYTFALFSKFENTIKNSLQNAILMGIRHLPFTLLILLLNISPVLVIMLLPQYFGIELLLLLLFWFSGVAYINGLLFHRIFAVYIPAETPSEDSTDSTGEEA